MGRTVSRFALAGAVASTVTMLVLIPNGCTSFGSDEAPIPNEAGDGELTDSRSEGAANVDGQVSEGGLEDGGAPDASHVESGVPRIPVVCPSVGTCTCPPAASCAVTCASGGCGVTCEKGSDCNVTCGGAGGCGITCQPGAACSYSGAGCTCGGGGLCTPTD